MTGGLHGEEEKSEDGEEGEEGQAQEEEVGLMPSSSRRRHTMSMASSNGPARLEER
jgi:hypothetical protein